MYVSFLSTGFASFPANSVYGILAKTTLPNIPLLYNGVAVQVSAPAYAFQVTPGFAAIIALYGANTEPLTIIFLLVVVFAASLPNIKSASCVINPKFPVIGLVPPNVSTYIPNDVGAGPFLPWGVLINTCCIVWGTPATVIVVVAGVAPAGAFIFTLPVVLEVGFDVGS